MGLLEPMKFNKKPNRSDLAIFICIITIIVQLVIQFDIPEKTIVLKEININLSDRSAVREGEFKIFSMGCNSNSMGLMFSCGDSVEGMKFYPEFEVPYIGEVYIYYDPEANNSIIHRFVGCADDDCNITIFKGDANAYAELVPRDWIRYFVTATYFNTDDKPKEDDLKWQR